MSHLEVLFEEVASLRHKYAKENKLNASDFNIFSLLLDAGDEVNLHSKFIHELLNPNGVHQQGNLFLKLFIETLGLNSTFQECVTFREKHNIDILLKSENAVIIIENKIYTEDHSSQLTRYKELIENQGYEEKDIVTLYLTLFGHAPREKVDFPIQNISYRKEIRLWIETCIENIKTVTVLHEVLKQYLSLVEEISLQSKKKSFLLDTKDFLLQENHLQLAIEMQEPIVEAKIEVQRDFWETLLSKLIPHYAFSFYNSNNDESLEGSIRRYYQKKRNIKNYGLEYEVEENLYFFVELRDNIYYGFYFLEEEKIEKYQQDALSLLGNQWEEVSSTVYWKYPDKPLNFKAFRHQNIFDLLDLNLKHKAIEKISNEIVTFIKNYTRNKIC